MAFFDSMYKLLIIFSLGGLLVDFKLLFSEGLKVLALEFMPMEDGVPVGPVLLPLLPLREEVVVDGETGLPGIMLGVGEDFV